MHVPDGTELLLCIPGGSSLPLEDQITAHLDGLITASQFTPIPHLHTTRQNHAVTFGARPLPDPMLAACALPARHWQPGPLIRALAEVATNDYLQWHTRYGDLPPAAPARCFLPFTDRGFSPADHRHGAQQWATQPLIAALRQEDPQHVARYSGTRLEALGAGLPTYIDYIIGTHLLPDALITTSRQVIATAPDRPHRLVTLREVMAHRDRVCDHLSTLDGDELLVTVAAGHHDPTQGCTCQA
ncbi:hypothetical protein AB0H43_13670 [Hamadaea sp. NPDC050747]|uniref:hypothetical protein n=1 Tax=Hamadaea sp. NPDC050747 TaxID=3155789 RepID=UPI0033D28854